MEHDLVALHFGRKTGPILRANFQALVKPSEFTGDPPFSNEFKVRVLIENNGKRVGKYVEAIFIFPSADYVRLAGRSGIWQDIGSLYPGTQARQFTDNFGVCHPKMAKSILEIGFTVSKAYLDSHTNETFIFWKIYADEMDPQEGSLTLHDLFT